MDTRLVYLLVFLFASCDLFTITKSSKLNVTHSLDIVSSSGINFAFNLYRQLGSTMTKNVFFSPISLSTSITISMQGAKGKSLSEMQEVLQYNLGYSMDVINLGMSQIISILKETDKNAVLNLANRLYIQKKLSIQSNFRSIINTYYQGDLKLIDFTKDTEKAMQQINKWVGKKTKGKIPKLFNFLDGATQLILINAIYFSGVWKVKFPKETAEDLFTTSNGSQVKANIMVLSKVQFNYAEDMELKCKILELPYKGNTYSMFIILPNAIDGLKELEQKMNYIKLKSLQSKMTITVINKLKFPKFKLSENYNMVPELKTLGMKTVFSNEADLSGITKKIPLKISQIVHNAIIEVNEQGSVAAAATGIVISARMNIEKPTINFLADHPFMFMIWNKKINNILFIGRLENPAEKLNN